MHELCNPVNSVNAESSHSLPDIPSHGKADDPDALSTQGRKVPVTPGSFTRSLPVILLPAYCLKRYSLRYQDARFVREVHQSQDHGISAMVSDETQGHDVSDHQQRWIKPDSAQAWEKVVETMTKYDDKMVEGWKDELSNLLIFVRHFCLFCAILTAHSIVTTQAGLFSAVVTAFSVQSYSLLQPNPVDRSVKILEQISLQLSSLSVNAGFINSTMSAIPTIPSPKFEATTSAVAINILWFLSLTLALMASLFAILAQQWVRHYTDIPLVTGSERARIRQNRFEALDRWFVPQIIANLAVLLQAALFVFFTGLVVLLWTINGTAAKAVTTTVALFFVIFFAATTIPIFVTDCPYKSTLAWAFRVLVAWVVYPLLPYLTCEFA